MIIYTLSQQAIIFYMATFVEIANEHIFWYNVSISSINVYLRFRSHCWSILRHTWWINLKGENIFSCLHLDNYSMTISYLWHKQEFNDHYYNWFIVHGIHFCILQKLATKQHYNITNSFVLNSSSMLRCCCFDCKYQKSALVWTNSNSYIWLL